MNVKKFINGLFKHYSKEVENCINDLKTKGRRKLQIPNLLTVSRIIAPFFILPFVFSSNLVGAIATTSLFALTDCFDGLIARKLNATSEFGKELDPIADKLFTLFLITPLLIQNPILISTLALEGIIAAINSNAKLKNNEPKTNSVGRIKTWALSLLMISSYCSMFMPINQLIINSFFAVTSCLQISAAVKYYVDDCEKDRKKQETALKSVKISTDESVKKNINCKRKELISVLKQQINILENSSKSIDDYNKCLKK